jgi:hypothetical protein
MGGETEAAALADAIDAAVEPGPTKEDGSSADSDATTDACAQETCEGCIPSQECSCASHNGNLYRFCVTARSWSDSETQCMIASMHLTRIDDLLENAWIRSTADAHAMGEIWIGIEDPTKTLQWQWPDGTRFWTGGAAGSAVGGLYNNWAPTNPSGNSVRNCASMLSTSSAQWSDRSCTSQLPYVCELY